MYRIHTWCDVRRCAFVLRRPLALDATEQGMANTLFIVVLRGRFDTKMPDRAVRCPCMVPLGEYSAKQEQSSIRGSRDGHP
jgi:hypothetical protein